MPEELDSKGPAEQVTNLPEDDVIESEPETELSAKQFRPTKTAWVDLRPTGVRGWLMFFVVTLVLIRPMTIASSLSQMDQATKRLSAAYPLLQFINLVNLAVGIAVIGFSIYAGIKLWKVQPNAVQFAKTYLLVSTIALIALSCLPFFAGLPGEANAAMLHELPVEILKQLVFPTVWYLYLTNSKRVAATYGLELSRPQKPTFRAER